MKEQGIPVPYSVVYYSIRFFEHFVAREMRRDTGFVLLSELWPVTRIIPDWRKKIANGEVKVQKEEIYSPVGED